MRSMMMITKAMTKIMKTMMTVLVIATITTTGQTPE